MEDLVLKVDGVTKIYGNQVVLDNFHMDIHRGDIYGFVGENGSGKTTIIRIISGLSFPNAGRYELFGVGMEDKGIVEVRKRMGAIVESPSIYPNMTAVENLRMLCLIFNLPESRIPTILEMVGLGNIIASKKKVGNFSLGMRQRLGIAMSLITEAEFMVLDEPLNGVDPEGIVDIRNLILRLNREYGITFLISSHILSELSLVATRYGIISHGKMLKEISAQEILNQCDKYYDIATSMPQEVAEALTKITDRDNIFLTNIGVRVRAKDLDLSVVMQTLQGFPIAAINTSTTSIEDYYLSVIKGANL